MIWMVVNNAKYPEQFWQDLVHAQLKRNKKTLGSLF